MENSRYKFRAWVSSKKTLCEVLIINYKEKTVQLPIETEVNAPYWWDETSWSFEDVELLQYTGLKDKNGVEIYEGDLLKKRNYKDGIYKVVWTKHGFELRHDFIRKYKGDSWEETAYLPIHERDYEVIGNVHEHPHLLKGE